MTDISNEFTERSLIQCQQLRNENVRQIPFIVHIGKRDQKQCFEFFFPLDNLHYTGEVGRKIQEKRFVKVHYLEIAAI